MNAENADQVVQNLLLGVAPERAAELAKIIADIDFRWSSDRPGLVLEAAAYFGRGVVSFNKRTMQQIWLISYFSWVALLEQSGFVAGFLMQGLPYDLSTPGVGKAGQREAKVIDDLADALRRLRSAEPDGADWPNEVPMLTDTNSHLEEQQQAAFELACFANGFVILHECGHVAERLAGKDYDGPAEELRCDAFAAELIGAQSDILADARGWPRALVADQRAMGIFLGQILILESSEIGLREPTDSHPAWTSRVRATLKFIETMKLDENGNFWVYATSIMLSRIRREGIAPGVIPYKTVRELFYHVLAKYEVI